MMYAHGLLALLGLSQPPPPSSSSSHPYASPDFASRCLSFNATQHIANSTLNVRQFVPAHTNLTFPENPSSCNRRSQVVDADICRIALEIATSDRSRITFELWLPDGADWTGRFLAVGNGGVDGCIKYEDLAYGVENGFVTAGSNNGHNGTTLVEADGNEDVVVDYAHRSLHMTVFAGKLLTKEMYRRAHSKSYYLGCSLGGRQGIDAGDKYPFDFDGIVAGAPAVDFNNLYSWRAHFPIDSAAAEFVPAETWKTLVHDEVLRQCDGIDGVNDGIIEDPLLCAFDPAKLACQDGESPPRCLTAPQVDGVSAVFSDYTHPDGNLIYPGLQPGAEILASAGLLAGKPFSLSVEWFKYVIYNNASWDPYSYTTADAEFAEEKNPGNIRTWPVGDDGSFLEAFRRRGGRLLVHHGSQDQQLSSFNSVRLYEKMRDLRGWGLDNWMRVFRVSGMGHCSGGPGAWVIGQGGGASSKGIGFDSESNALAALVEWVEGGKGPETILGRKFVNDSVEMGVEFQRRHCRLPLRNEYIGGDASRPESWECRGMQ